MVHNGKEFALRLKALFYKRAISLSALAEYFSLKLLSNLTNTMSGLG